MVSAVSMGMSTVGLEGRGRERGEEGGEEGGRGGRGGMKRKGEGEMV